MSSVSVSEGHTLTDETTLYPRDTNTMVNRSVLFMHQMSERACVCRHAEMW